MAKKIKTASNKKALKPVKKSTPAKTQKKTHISTSRDFGYGFDNFFDSFSDDMFSMPSIFKKEFDKDFKVPQINLSETADKYKIKAEIPGVKQNDIEIEYCDGTLAISAKKEHEKEENGENFYKQECSYGSFYKTISLPDDVKEDSIKADYKNGVLDIEITKTGKGSAKPKKKIAVK